jgi:hypothetical protein
VQIPELIIKNAAMEHTPTTTLTHLLMNEIKLLHLCGEEQRSMLIHY